MNITEHFLINGKPLLAPDAGVECAYEDIDGADAGRDQSGVMHRQMVRSKVGKWTFRYDFLTQEELAYVENLFPEAATFTFTHPDRRTGKTSQCKAYRSKVGMSWYNAKLGLWRNYSFSIIGC